ncbi:MAG: hypothetical protein AB2597_16185, partial [Candidatus Thiodiazotropha sp.]
GTENPRVGSSILSLATIHINGLPLPTSLSKISLREFCVRLKNTQPAQNHQLGFLTTLITHRIGRLEQP